MPDRYLTPEEFAEFVDRYRTCDYRALNNIYYETALSYADKVRKAHGEKAYRKARRLINSSLDWEVRYYWCAKTVKCRFVPDLLARIGYRICTTVFERMTTYLDTHTSNDGEVLARLHALGTLKTMRLFKQAANIDWIHPRYEPNQTSGERANETHQNGAR